MGYHTKLKNSFRMSSYTDWQKSFDKIADKKNKVILELGCGLGTKYLVNNFKKVYSYEVTYNDKWYKKTKKDLQEYENWESIFYYNKYIKDSDEKIVKTKGKERDIKPLKRYFTQLRGFVDLNEIDIAFVDQGNHLRGEAAEYFMSKGIPLVIIHDSKNYPRNTDKIYGYDLLNPEKYNYSYHSFTKGQGTVFFYNKDYFKDDETKRNKISRNFYN